MTDYKIKTQGEGKQENITQALSAFDTQMREREVLAKAKELGLGYANLMASPINSDALSLVPAEEAEVAQLAVFLQVGRKIRVGLVDPENVRAKEVLERLRGKGYEVNLNLISEDSLTHVLGMYAEKEFKRKVDLTTEIDESGLASYAAEIAKLQELQGQWRELTAGEIVNRILVGAVRTGASDIHFQPEDGRVNVFFRIDGILQKIFELEPKLYEQLTAQIKHDGRVKINVNTVPQDGELSFEINERRIDVRLSTLPTQFGETIVLRILDSKKGKVEFDKLGFEAEKLDILRRALEIPYGMILATGPTGSGKTTTLYAMLNKLSTPEKKVVTLEDPVEYHLEGVAQAGIREEEGFTFASGLKAALRQDPDVIMVGEIRDAATAEAAVQAALTGHVVLSTLHTNTAVEALPRLLNLKVAGFLIAPSVCFIIAQRLVRTVCPHCVQQSVASEAEQRHIESILAAMPEGNRVRMPEGLRAAVPESVRKSLPEGAAVPLGNFMLSRAVGCAECSGSGYLGRTVVSEIVEVDADVRAMILDNASGDEILQKVREKGMLTLREDGLKKVLEHKTTFDEYIRVIGV